MKMDMIVRLKRMALITFAFFLSWMSANGECMSMQKQLSNVQFLNITLKNTEVSIALADSPMITYDSDILSFFTIGEMFQIPVADVQGWHFSDTPTAIIQRETPKPNIAQGYVFMVWDFRNPDAPQIHVRTWQPEYLDKTRGHKMNPEDIFTLGDFDI